MLDQLEKIKSFIISNISLIDNEVSFHNNLEGYLQRLIDPIEPHLPKDASQLKANHQLLCCIGIDIKYKSVPIERYNEIFRNIDYADKTLSPRKLFVNAIKFHDLEFRTSYNSCDNSFNILVFPISDWVYYIDESILGIKGRVHRLSHVIKSLYGYLKAGNRISLKGKTLVKPSGYYWVCTQAEFQPIVNKKDKISNEIVDRLGLSHFKFKDIGQKHYFYINLTSVGVDTFKPNATIVDWDKPDTGFVSYMESCGMTYCITGMKIYKNGMKERVFKSTSFTEDQYSKIFIDLLADQVILPVDIDTDGLINEGVKRFLNT